MSDDDELRPSEWLAQVARRHAIVLVSLAAHVVVWLALPRVWTTLVKMQGKTGHTSWVSVGSRDALLVAAAAFVYVIARFLGPRSSRWGMRSPTDSEVAVARVLVRAACVVGLWAALVVAVRA